MKGTSEQLKSTVYKLATEGYLYELRMLIRIVKSNKLNELLPIFSNYENFLNSERKNIFKKDLVDKLINNQIIYASDSSEIGKQLFTCANLSACCEVFGGWTIPVGELEMSRTNEYLQLALKSAGSDIENIGRNMAVRLNKCDTARVIQAVKLLGLLRVDTQSCDQLSLCCSIGERDRHALHQMPYISAPHQTMLSSQHQAYSPLVFGTNSYRPKHIVMIDNDPALTPVYEQFNREEERLLAMNCDLYDGLGKLAIQIKNKLLRPRDLVVSFRLAPEGFPDVTRYLDCLGDVISDEADLIMTIGAGDNLAEFKHRIKVMDDLYKDLTKREMAPVRIKYCKGKTPKQQHMNLTFGLSQYASYETIYCRIYKERLI